MRVKFIFLLFASAVVATNRDDALAKIMKYEVIWNKSMLGTLMDNILGDVAALKTQAECASNIMGYAVSMYTSNPMAALSLLSLKSTMDSCLKPYNSDTMSTLEDMMPGAGLAITKTYKLMHKKAKTMTANGKASAAIIDQLYAIGTAVVTPDLVQHIIYYVEKNITAGQWSCCVKSSPSVVTISSFDLTYKPNKWFYPYKK